MWQLGPKEFFRMGKKVVFSTSYFYFSSLCSYILFKKRFFFRLFDFRDRRIVRNPCEDWELVQYKLFCLPPPAAAMPKKGIFKWRDGDERRLLPKSQKRIKRKEKLVGLSFLHPDSSSLPFWEGTLERKKKKLETERKETRPKKYQSCSLKNDL